MSLQHDLAIQILTEAASAPLGIRIRVDSVSPMVQAASRAKQILYRFKQENSDFSHLVIRFDPVDSEHYLWIYPSDPSLPTEDNS